MKLRYSAAAVPAVLLTAQSIHDLGSDGAWDFRRHPHVHTWVNIWARA
jgi:hypothetical protein